MPVPDLPEPAHADIDSMLSRKFGKEVANYFAGSPLNRVSFLRTDNIFLSSAFKHPSTNFILFNDLKPLVHSPEKLAYVSLKDIAPLVGEDPYAKTEEEIVEEYDSSKTTPQMIFLGLDERGNVKETRESSNTFSYKDLYRGAPFFAVDVTPKGSVAEQAKALIKEVEGRKLKFQEGRQVMSLPADEAAIYAQARALLDWNARNPFCAGCGQPTLSINAGGKRTCPPSDLSRLQGAIGSTSGERPINMKERPPCVTRQGISNLCFPRTDPTIIVAVVSHDNKRMLLGRSKRFPQYWYSTLAGFCEPAESIEEAVRREVWEETGVTAGRVVIHSTQPWPYPANLMIGAIAQTIPDGEKIDLGNDPELEDAKWYDYDEVRQALRVGTSGIGEDAGPQYKEGDLRLPPGTAIANQLISAVVTHGFLGGEHKM